MDRSWLGMQHGMKRYVCIDESNSESETKESEPVSGIMVVVVCSHIDIILHSPRN